MSLSGIDKPGCYGSFSMFDAKSDCCKGCKAFRPCGERAVALLEAVRDKVDVSDYIAKHNNAGGALKTSLALSTTIEFGRKAKAKHIKLELTDRQIQICAGLPVRSAELYSVLARNGKLDAMLMLPSMGQNPFNDGTPAFMEVTFDALLSGGFSKRGLRELLMSRLQWLEGTAFSHVSKVIPMLLAAGSIERLGNHFTLRK